MPIYEYQCERCGHRLEALQKLSEPPLTDCPECKESALERLISPAAFHLKGTGWYATDFRDKGKAKEKKANGEAKDEGKPAESDKGSDKGGKEDAQASQKGGAEKGTSSGGEGTSSKSKLASAG